MQKNAKYFAQFFFFAGNPSSEALDPYIIGSVPILSKTFIRIFEIKKIEIFIPFEVWEIAVLLAG